MSMKHIMLEGRLGRDAEIKTTAKGNKYVTFTLAVDSRGKDGEKTTDWFTVSSFQENHLGKFADYLKKGSGLIVMGTPSFSTWIDRNGQARIDLNVRASNLEFPTLGGNKDEQKTEQEPVARTAEKPAQAPAQTYTSTPTYTPTNATADPEDDLPF